MTQHQHLGGIDVVPRAHDACGEAGQKRLMEIERTEPGLQQGEPVGIMRELSLHPGLGLRVIRLAVDREYVHEETELAPLLAGDDGAGVMDLCEYVFETLFGSVDMEYAAVTAGGVIVGPDEAFEILAGHHNVDVVIPRNEAFVPHSSEESPVSH